MAFEVIEGEKSRPEGKRLVAIVYGRVQGIGFRYFTQAQARRLGLTGHVRNRWDGAVEVMAEGQEEALRRLLNKLRIGPRAAVVERVEVDWQEATNQYRGFGIRF